MYLVDTEEQLPIYLHMKASASACHAVFTLGLFMPSGGRPPKVSRSWDEKTD